MIKVTCLYRGKKLINLRVCGHGGDEKGEDIYCAGVSSCLIGALNALNDAEDFDIAMHTGYLNLDSKGKTSMHDEIVLETLITQLATIAKSYPERVQIKISEKEG